MMTHHESQMTNNSSNSLHVCVNKMTHRKEIYMKTSYRLMTESEIKQIRKGDTLYLDAEFNELALHTAIASKDAYAYIEDGIEQWMVEDTEGNVYGLDTLCTKKEKVEL